jgi:hypothetical protein
MLPAALRAPMRYFKEISQVVRLWLLLALFSFDSCF